MLRHEEYTNRFGERKAISTPTSVVEECLRDNYTREAQYMLLCGFCSLIGIAAVALSWWMYSRAEPKEGAAVIIPCVLSGLLLICLVCTCRCGGSVMYNEMNCCHSYIDQQNEMRNQEVAEEMRKAEEGAGKAEVEDTIRRKPDETSSYESTIKKPKVGQRIMIMWEDTVLDGRQGTIAGPLNTSVGCYPVCVDSTDGFEATIVQLPLKHMKIQISV